MKVIRSAFDVLERKRLRQEANRGCNKCPFCHENISISEAIHKGYGLRRGISSISIARPVKTGVFSSEYKTVEIFSCQRCGAEWEGNPY